MKESVKLQTAVNNIIQRLGPPSLPPPLPQDMDSTLYAALPRTRLVGNYTNFHSALLIFTADTQAITRPLSSPRTQNATRGERRVIQFPFVRRRYCRPTSKCNASASQGRTARRGRAHEPPHFHVNSVGRKARGSKKPLVRLPRLQRKQFPFLFFLHHSAPCFN